MAQFLGIELGSTRIKSILIDEKASVIAQGVYEWENVLVDGLWSYPLEKAVEGLRASYADLLKNYGKKIEKVDCIGISAMMHGYLAFDKQDNLLAPFRTWRNTNTGKASEELTDRLNFHIPMRWSVSQYYQSVLDKLSHVKEVAFLTTLSGYIHYILTGCKVLGVNDASGMFPVDGCDYDNVMMSKFNKILAKKGVKVDFKSVLPKVLKAGESAGFLTEEGAKILDPTGELKAGIAFCPPEGDMGTGMICTNSIAPRTANVSSGTSANLTIVLEKALKKYYQEIDIVSTPDGKPSALIHTNNCTSEINEWVNLIEEAVALFGGKATKGQLYDKLFKRSLESDDKVGGLTCYNFLAGEPLANTTKGLPTVFRSPDGNLNLANFMQMQIYSAIASLSLGMDILKKEGVKIDRVLAHGGFYTTDFVGQNATSAVLNCPVTVMKTASEGGAWGMAILAMYTKEKDKTLAEFLDDIFSKADKKQVMADDREIAKWNNYLNQYKLGLKAEKIASEAISVK